MLVTGGKFKSNEGAHAAYRRTVKTRIRVFPMVNIFTGKLGVQQRVLPTYRGPFFDTLASRCTDGLSVFAGLPRPDEAIACEGELEIAIRARARNVHLMSGRFYLCWQRGIKDWLDHWSPDALVVAADPRLLSARTAIRWSRNHDVPVIGWGLGTLNESRGRAGLSIVSRLRSKLYRSYDAVIAYSSKAADDYMRVGVPAERIFIAHNAISTEDAKAAVHRFPAGGKEVRKWRDNHALTKPTIIFVGRLIREKRLDLLIESCRAIGEHFDLLVVGDGPERTVLERIAAERYPATQFIGHQEGEQLSLAFAAADLFVLPGTGGLAIYEAMAHGKPVIVGQGDGTEADLVQDGRNGILVAPDDIGELTNAIQSYIGHPDRIREEGQESRHIIDEEASIGKMALTFVSALSYAVEANT